jgi:hypothetical protein
VQRTQQVCRGSYGQHENTLGRLQSELHRRKEFYRLPKHQIRELLTGAAVVEFGHALPLYKQIKQIKQATSTQVRPTAARPTLAAQSPLA